jgi:hypothetical protein
MPYGYLNQLPPAKRHTPKGKAEQKKNAKKVGLIAGVIGLFTAFLVRRRKNRGSVGAQ